MDLPVTALSLLPPPLRVWLRTAPPDPRDAWETCPRAEWVARLALALGADRRPLVAASYDVAYEAAGSRRVRDLRAARALSTSKRWLDEEATGAEAWARGLAAFEAAATLDGPKAAVMRAAASVAFSCDDRADAAYYAHEGYPAQAVAAAVEALGDERETWAADRIRSHLGGFDVRDAYARAQSQLAERAGPTPGAGHTFYF